MGKLTKKETKLHQQVMELVHSDRVLKYEEKEFILQYWQRLVCYYRQYP